MNIIQMLSVKNDCYKNNVNRSDSRYTTFQARGPKGLMLHSVGCAQPSAKVFATQWNRSGLSVAVHAVIQADGTVYQCLPWNYRGWHAGGSANNTHVGVEMTEPSQIHYTGGSTFTCNDKSAAQAQVKGTYNTAVQLFAKLCKQYGLNPLTDIISHREGNAKGVASNHGDPEHLWRGLGMSYTMDGFRKDVKAAMNSSSTSKNYKVGWHKDSVGWWYAYDADHYYANTTATISGKSYTFDNKGYWIENTGSITAPTKPGKLEIAQYYDKNGKGGVRYKVKANGGLRMRTGAGTSKSIIATLSNGSVVYWYGYYNVISGVKWYLVQDTSGRTGYVSSQYLTK